MNIEVISEELFNDFVSKYPLCNFYQSIEWLKVKNHPNRPGEILGLFQNKKLIGVSLVFYIKILKGRSLAYLSRGFIYDYQDIPSFKKALISYFKIKKVIFIKLDPLIVYQTKQVKENFVKNENGYQILNELIKNNFKHFGFNKRFETYQMRYIHHINLKDSYSEQLKTFDKSTQKNNSLALHKGVSIEYGSIKDLKLATTFFDKTAARKHIESFDYSFYEKIMHEFKDNANLYLIFIDAQKYLYNAQNSLSEAEKELTIIKRKKEVEKVGKGLLEKEKIVLSKINKYHNEIKEAKSLKQKTYIASMLTITKYKETSSYVSGMDSNYKSFYPKYVMYPQMIEDAIKRHDNTVNFLGITGIFDPNDKDYGIYEIKKGFNGESVEYIGEFDLPLNKLMYSLYKIINKIKKH